MQAVVYVYLCVVPNYIVSKPVIKEMSERKIVWPFVRHMDNVIHQCMDRPDAIFAEAYIPNGRSDTVLKYLDWHRQLIRLLRRIRYALVYGILAPKIR